jgi:hypothetical protein
MFHERNREIMSVFEVMISMGLIPAQMHCSAGYSMIYG